MTDADGIYMVKWHHLYFGGRNGGRKPRMNGKLVQYLAVAVLAVCGGVGRGAGPDFDEKVAPLLSVRCLDCHSGSKPKGGLDLSRRRSAMEGGDQGVVIVPGKPDASL